MKKILFATLLTITLCGCIHDDKWDKWNKIEIDNYSYYVYDNNVISDSSPLFIVLPGLGDSYENDVSNVIKDYLRKKNISGTIIAPYINHTDGNINYYISKLRDIINQTQYDKSRLYLIGVSAGACKILELSNEWIDIAALIPIVAGSYKNGGGSPYDELIIPDFDTYVWFLNGYDEDVLNKYGIFYDGTVFVDPTIRCYNEIKDFGLANMTLAKGFKHSNTYKLLKKDDIILDWLVSIKK